MSTSVKTWSVVDFPCASTGNRAGACLANSLFSARRRDLVDTRLKQRALRAWIDDRGAQAAQVSDRLIHNVNVLFVALAEQAFVHELAHHADANVVQSLPVSEGLVGLRRYAPDTECGQRIPGIIARDDRQYASSVLDGAAEWGRPEY